MEQVKIVAQPREKAGKDYARQIRRQGLVPGIFYGKDVASTPIQLETRELARLIRGGHENVIINLTIETEDGQVSYPAIIKEIQRDPIDDTLLNIDLLIIKLTEKMATEVPLVLIGEPKGVRGGGTLEQVLRRLEIRCLPTDLPGQIEVDVSDLGIGDSLHVRDLKVADTIEVLTASDGTVATISVPAVEEVVEEVVGEKVPAEEEGPPSEAKRTG